MASILRRWAAARSSPAVEHRRGVAERLVEERREQVVGQVVVAVDVLPRLRWRALLVSGLAPLDEPPESLQGLGDQRRHVAGEWSEQISEIGVWTGVPVAGHVGLTEADLGVGCEAGEECVRSVDDHDRVAARPRADRVAVREPDAQRQSGDRAPDDRPRRWRLEHVPGERTRGRPSSARVRWCIVAVLIASTPGAWLRPTPGPGSRRATFISTAIGSGKTISIWPRSRPLQIDRAGRGRRRS